MMGTEGRSNVKHDKKRRAMMRKMRKKLNLKQSELAALAGISQRTLARVERGKHVSLVTEDRVSGAILRTAARRNPEAVNQAAKPFVEAAEKWERVLSLEPGSELALKVEKLNGKSLAELKAQAERSQGFFEAERTLPFH
jgi:transcriptional regulator with XRE-family HTH domain